jgi:glutamate-ammonia-ligase adenylyltransferase
VGVLMLDGIIDPVAAGAALARLADATLHALLPHVEEEFSHTAGRLPGGAFAILALGGYGARCLTYTSDLDLVFLYDCPPDASAEKDGKSLSPNHYYSRLSQRIISALTVLTGEGRLFEVDMRLRPSGRAGLIAVSLDAFVHYQSHEAWAWEHMSLAKARIVAGDPALAARVTGAIGQILERPRDPRQLASAIWDMRRRFDKEFGRGDIWALKTARGGLSDLDWLVQYLLLIHWHRLAAPPPDMAGQLACLGAAGVLAADDAETLADAFQLLFAARALRRLLIGPRGDFAQASISVRAALAQALGETHFSVVTQRVKAAKQSIARLFSSTIPELQDHAENKGGQP